MGVLEKIAFFRNRRDEVPNQELAKELALTKDNVGIQEIAINLTNKDRNISSDCLKVMYEIGYIDPKLIAPYVENFLTLLNHKDNRKVWGAMIALATIAEIKHAEIAPHIPEVIGIMQKGTLITTVWGVKLLARVARDHPELEGIVKAEFIDVLATCLPRDVPSHLESMLPALNAKNKGAFIEITEKRKPEMTAAHLTRLKKILKVIAGI